MNAQIVQILHLPLADRPAENFVCDIFGGGKDYAALGRAEPGLRSPLFSGLWNWMRGLTIGLLYVLTAIYAVVKNWGIAIMLLAVFVRILLHPIARRAIVSQQRFAAVPEKIKPELKEIKRNYKGGEQSELILPLLGAYFNLLPGLMALTTLASIKFAPAPAADVKTAWRQSSMLALMTLVFFLLFYTFPSGSKEGCPAGVGWFKNNPLPLRGLPLNRGRARTPILL